jgi:hypothetical protein
MREMRMPSASELDDTVACQRLLPGLSNPERPANAVQGIGHQALLVHLMGGKMGVNSEPGKGSEFRFKV